MLHRILDALATAVSAGCGSGRGSDLALSRRTAKKNNSINSLEINPKLHRGAGEAGMTVMRQARRGLGAVFWPGWHFAQAFKMSCAVAFAAAARLAGRSNPRIGGALALGPALAWMRAYA